MQTINDLHKLIGLNANQEIQSYKTKSLIGPGENYGSTILDVEIIIKDVDKNAPTTLHCVVKLCPRNEFLKIAFNIPVTFRKEVRFYHTIVPLLEAFQKERGIGLITSFPTCYGSRISLNPNTDVVDDDAAISLENLKLSGYTLVDRMVGFDFETSKLIIENLAAFHAVPMALKLLKPDVFNEHVLPVLKNYAVFEFGDDLKNKSIDLMIHNLRASNVEESVIERVRPCVERGADHYSNLPDVSPLFATIGHNDFWTNNTMVKFEHGKPIKNVILDFQLIRYNSLANDVVLFLYTSVRLDVMESQFDALLRIYYETFIDILEKFKCDSGAFTYNLFIEEIKTVIRESEMFHILIMLKPMFTLKSKITSLEEFAMEDLLRNDVSENFGDKVARTVNDIAKRRWI